MHRLARQRQYQKLIEFEAPLLLGKADGFNFNKINWLYSRIHAELIAFALINYLNEVLRKTDGILTFQTIFERNAHNDYDGLIFILNSIMLYKYNKNNSL